MFGLIFQCTAILSNWFSSRLSLACDTCLRVGFKVVTEEIIISFFFDCKMKWVNKLTWDTIIMMSIQLKSEISLVVKKILIIKHVSHMKRLFLLPTDFGGRWKKVFPYRYVAHKSQYKDMRACTFACSKNIMSACK